jgi:ATP-dependent RNA helicase RhlE
MKRCTEIAAAAMMRDAIMHGQDLFRAIFKEEHPLNRFAELKLPEQLEKALAAMAFETPTPIQAQAIPVALTGRDLIGCAQTGTGKTAAFGIPMITTLLSRPDRDALILVPTRELAAQVASVLEQLAKFLPEMKMTLLIGGVAMKPQLKSLARKPRIIVATPGRLLDHLRSRSARLDRTAMLVLDEADRMLDLGFAPQLQAILRFLPRERQTLMFSATLPPDIERLARDYLRDPQRVQVGPVSQAVPKIEQKIREVSGGDKNSALLDELNARQGTALVFARTQHRTDRVARYLESYGVEVARIHGGRSQGQRNRALDGFRDGTFRVLVATDIAARGIDIDHVAHVINYDLPNVPEDYIHRIGRTGRAGRSGEAISLISHEERPLWRDIQKLLGSKGSAMPTKVQGSPAGAGGEQQPRRAPAPSREPSHARPREQSQPQRQSKQQPSSRHPQPQRQQRDGAQQQQQQQQARSASPAAPYQAPAGGARTPLQRRQERMSHQQPAREELGAQGHQKQEPAQQQQPQRESAPQSQPQHEMAQQQQQQAKRQQPAQQSVPAGKSKVWISSRTPVQIVR